MISNKKDNMNTIENIVERLCNKYPRDLVPQELLWDALRHFENASLGADDSYEVLKRLPSEAKAKLGEALRSLIGDQPDALKHGYGSLHSVSGTGTGVLHGAAFFERIIPPEWLKLVARLQEGLETSGMAHGSQVIKGSAVVYRPGIHGLEAGPGESVIFGKLFDGTVDEDE
jgi:hypothetical protein